MSLATSLGEARAAGRGRLDIVERTQGRVRIIALTGDLDLATAALLCVRLNAARCAPRARVVVDLTRLSFCDSSGLRALMRAAHEVSASAGRVAVVVEPGSPVARVLAVSGVEEHLAVRRSAAAAVAALGSR